MFQKILEELMMVDKKKRAGVAKPAAKHHLDAEFWIFGRADGIFIAEFPNGTYFSDLGC